MSAVLEGDLRHFLVTEVFQMLCLAGATGRIVFERNEERIEVGLDRGQIVRAGSSRGSVRLGEMLVHAGALSESSLERALVEQREHPPAPLGELIVEHGLADRTAVVDALGEVVRRVLLTLVLWGGGRFRFEPEEATEASTIAPALDIERTLLDWMRLADELRATA